jgi:trehalose synthase
MPTGDPDVHILNNVGAIEVNAFQPHADVVVLKSIREGLGLTVPRFPSDLAMLG